ncbi:proline racemase family protein [Thermoanaerobacterium sp. DL9XJH110]|uniref:proline racemase family protein n=1 Tax=Thermoanaerobacterium sp. DL9XJH110 TaxID=3386643 RepID=UPI003BB5E97C
MNVSRSIIAVDSHTMGEPTRVVIGGIPRIPGNSMPEKKEYLEKHMDHIRRALMLEPRGHDDMFGSIITAPTRPEAHLGIIFMDTGGYLNMCGHGTIGAATVAVEMGMVEVREPETEVVLETPAGLVKARVRVEKGRATGVTFQNVPAFLFKKDVEVEIPPYGTVKIDIAFGGSFFAIVKAKDLGIEVKKENIYKLIDMGLKVREEANKKVRVYHPEKPHIKTVDLAEISDCPTHPRAHAKNVVIFGEKSVDRSPCGTGTCAKMADLYFRGELGLNQDFIHESILGTLFTGRLVGRTKVGEFEAVIPEITGRAFITGVNHYMLDEEDPLKYGFSLR